MQTKTSKVGKQNCREVLQHAPDKGTCADVSYTYHALNYRIERMGADRTTEYAYGRSGAITYQKTTGTTGTTVRSYAYLNNEVIGWTDTDAAGKESRKYAVTDMLGSETKVLDETGRVLWSSEYTAFGTAAGTVTDSVDFSGMFTGKDIDAETGLTYHWNRWRSEDGSCFISEDPARDGSNWYGYCGNNPMTYSDPTGLDACEFYNSLGKPGSDSSSSAYEQAVAHSLGSAYYQTGTPSGPQSPTVGTLGNEEALRQYENKEIGLVECWSKLDFKSLFSDSLKELKSDVAKGINETKDSFIEFYNENGVKGIAGAVSGMLSPVNVQEEEIVGPCNR